ncbi:hypothetical protein [Bradyrhizobium sp. CCBAU 11357]|uniref:hypothetical protein n=1 Tax=Bradyrhizobium sp. CCBAU 11357 TaxID=1630808 RepID=UPI00230406AD|nr:hypothetical protein [Bradyrhizobium sp. CCBAU 11357]MDA9498637.1 hypothetical protein [Bradyrhizobium sp. CCBAU 11357]
MEVQSGRGKHASGPVPNTIAEPKKLRFGAYYGSYGGDYNGCYGGYPGYGYPAASYYGYGGEYCPPTGSYWAY